MASKFAKFIEENGIDSRRILAASTQLERLRLADRVALATAAKKGKSKAKEAESSETAPVRKVPSGRPVTQVMLDRVAAGKPVQSRAKARLVRAVNRLLEQKKKDAVDQSALF